MVSSRLFCQLQPLPEVCAFASALVCAGVCVGRSAGSSEPFRVRGGGEKRRVIAAQSGYCVLYQEDKPIRGTLIDINFHSLHLSSLSGPFSFNGRIHSDDL